MAEQRGVAILVGAGDAIGAAVARRFAKGGYAVCICRRDAAKSQALVDELKAAGLEAHAFSVDARQEAEVQNLFAEVEKNIGPIEVCLFNAGSNVNKPLLDTTEKLFFKAWELACYGGFLVGRSSALHASAQPRHHLLYRSHRQRSWQPGLCGLLLGKIRTSRGGAGDARELGPKISTSCTS